MKTKLLALLKKYETQKGNIEWHIKTNEPWGSELDKCNHKLEVLNDIVKDLTDLARSDTSMTKEQILNKWLNKY